MLEMEACQLESGLSFTVLSFILQEAESFSRVNVGSVDAGRAHLP